MDEKKERNNVDLYVILKHLSKIFLDKRKLTINSNVYLHAKENKDIHQKSNSI